MAHLDEDAEDADDDAGQLAINSQPLMNFDAEGAS